MNSSLSQCTVGEVIVEMVFQHFESFPQFTVAENLTLAQVRALGRPQDEAYKAAHTMLDRAGLLAYADKFPWQLSSGQQQRVATASVLSEEVVVMVCDQADIGC